MLPYPLTAPNPVFPVHASPVDMAATPWRLPAAAASFRRQLACGSSICSASLPLPAPSMPVADRVPLFLRPLSYSATHSDLRQFQHWARSLASSSNFSDNNAPDAAHLIRELTWLLQDATDGSRRLPGWPDGDQAVVRLRVGLDELYRLWEQRVQERRPLQYIVGCEHWRDLVLVVKEGVLIPRPETEKLADLAAEVPGFQSGWWADLGTGSGALAIAIARALGDEGKVFATDLSPVAVEVAACNVKRYSLQNKVEVRHGSWFEALQDVKGQLTGIVSNPPYIPSCDLPGLQAEVRKHEPQLALDGGDDGMDHLLHLCEECISALRPGAFFAFETNGDQHCDFMANLISKKWGCYFRDVRKIPDFAGINRFLVGFRC